MLVEVCANSLESAMNAEKAGADRIELCSELAVGGITPSYGLLKSVKENIGIPVHVLIRPRSGDFSYTDGEFNSMKQNIALCVEMGFDGIVSGVLHTDFRLDVGRTKELVELSEGLKFTFHRAFDWVLDPLQTMKQLEGLGVDYMLSSGQEKSALEGIALLSRLNDEAASCAVMPGGGVNAGNVHKFKDSGFKVVHLSGTCFEPKLKVVPKVSMNAASFLQDQGVFVSNVEAIRKVLKEVK
ncbi:copper homeostasis protein CutC [Maribacter polysiphoniae]|uniref:PF03932 family protein CutC n=1 Tax=Maribacter polysiphoniae TaxID=429344 RepID=A0A316DZ93_9FLAO|nr:copper homeostasis protein CutC [Maribacter polysiphoniae]MBD1259616.1 copper homeostasis protein CutC [Maribacter polysiphoniae]PWK23245.1 copper homeostasis protein [Maribacter polysiphoniae]